MAVRKALLLLVLALGLAWGQSNALGLRRAISSGREVFKPYTFCFLGCTHVGGPMGGGQLPWDPDLYNPSNPRNWYQLRHFVDSMNVAGCAFGIVAGDWAHDIWMGVPEWADSAYSAMNRAHFPWYRAMGNHEAFTADTLAHLNPYAGAGARFGIPNYYFLDVKNLRLIFLQNSCNYNITSSTDYQVNNPWYGGRIPGYDWDGITDPNSPQRQMLATAMAGLNGRIPVLVAHRPTYGSNDNTPSRLSFGRGARGTGYIHSAELALATGHRGLGLFADQHITLCTEAIFDSAVAAKNGRGFYHNQVNSGSGLRICDSTNTFVAGTPWLQCYVCDKEGTSNPTLTAARTSKGIEETITSTNDPDCDYRWFAMTFDVRGDAIVRRVWRVYSPRSSGAPGYRGAGALVMVDERTLYMDVRDR